MPIECYLVSESGDVAVELDPVEAGRCFTLQDFSNGVIRVIAVACHHHDLGGQVHELDQDEFEHMLESAQDGVFKLDESSKIDDIFPNGVYEEELSGPSGKVTRLILKHELPHTVSMN